jgi:hypothetical protein
MKKRCLLFFLFSFATMVAGYAQSVSATDFFAGKWEISITGSPRGDVTFVTELVRKEGKLTGELSDPTGSIKENRPITRIDESKSDILIYFESSQGDEITINLSKINQDNLKGSLMDRYDATAKRIKEVE